MKPLTDGAMQKQNCQDDMRLCVALVSGWTLIGAAACAVTFAVSTIPAPLPEGRSTPFWLEIIWVGLSLCMLLYCTLAPIPLLITGYMYLLRSARAARRRRVAWIAAAGASIAIEIMFWFRLMSFLDSGGPGLSYMNWHALDFSAGFLTIGALMAYVLISARKSATRNSLA